MQNTGDYAAKRGVHWNNLYGLDSWLNKDSIFILIDLVHAISYMNSVQAQGTWIFFMSQNILMSQNMQNTFLLNLDIKITR